MAYKAQLAAEMPVAGGWKGRNNARGYTFKGVNGRWYDAAKKAALEARRLWWPDMSDAEAAVILNKRIHDPEGASAARIAANVEESKKANAPVKRESEPAPEAAGKPSYAIGLGKRGKGRKGKKRPSMKKFGRNVIGTTLSGGVIRGQIQAGGFFEDNMPRTPWVPPKMGLMPYPRPRPSIDVIHGSQMGGFVMPEGGVGDMRHRPRFGNLIMY